MNTPRALAEVVRDEMFMREYIQEWKRLMQTEPNIQIKREP